jgi:regulator of protease activity HflC (stomatin/prohibitin superfamily)
MHEADRLVDRLTATALAESVLFLAPLFAVWLRPGWAVGHPALGEIARSGLAALPGAALLLVLAGLAGTRIMIRARHAAPPPRVTRRHAVLGRLKLRAPSAARAGWAARWPQALVVVPLAVLAGLLAWRARPLTNTFAAPDIGFALGAGAMVLAFPLLVAERSLAGTRTALLPEATGLRGLFFLAASTMFLCGLIEVAAAGGVPGQITAAFCIALALVATAAELGLRATARLFLPPPPAPDATAACSALIAQLLSSGMAEGSFAAPIRQHLGIDFSRSWALGYVRSAILPLSGGLLLLAWVLSGVVIVPMEARAVYERFGAPLRVLHPGLHVALPWPMGATRRLEFGAVHALRLAGDETQAGPTIGAEDPFPVAADRLWEQAHPGELALLVASASGAGATRQSFQSVSADLRLLYRIGLTDQAAFAATYATSDPPTLLRALSGQAIANYFAGRTLADALGADREAMASALRDTIQQALDRAGAGIDMVAVSIEAIHPPAGAAAAYHAVRAAEIAARASVASEQGRAIVVRAQSLQYATEQRENATAGAAEIDNAATAAATRFAADRDAAQTGQAFLLERYFADLSAALSKVPLTIIDHRLAAPDAPVLDLRPLAGAALPTDPKGE